MTVRGTFWPWLVTLATTGAVIVALRAAAAALARRGRGPWHLALERLAMNRPALLAATVLIGAGVVALLATHLAPFDPTDVLDDPRLRAAPPSAEHPFGTDFTFRDVFSRVIAGTRVSLAVGFLSVIVSLTVGTAYGVIAGVAGGRVDGFLMRVIDACLAIPRILLLIVVMTLWESISQLTVILVLGLTGWFGISRLVRAEVLATESRDFIASARALGASEPRVVLRHILPSIASTLAVAATLGIGQAIILEAGLSYLGLGIRDASATWGRIIQEGQLHVASAWWLSVFPGLAIMATVMACNTLGDALRDALDPRQVDAPAAMT